ncbi:MAG: sodium/proline symporter, partial [Candidatus Methanoplasma sp.]|nr:sodium/proline symporter [Candidatus Methanoplasma sp.]
MNYEVFAVFIVYFAIVLTVGFYFYKRSESMSDYFLGGRSMNPYVTALSAQASDMSSWLLMGLPGAVILFGLGEAWIGIGLAIGSYLSWLFVAKRLRKHSVVAGDSTTVPEFFSNRYNDRKGILRIMSAVIILFFFTIYVASGFKGCGLILNTVVPDISLEIAMLVGAVIIIGYTFMGGFKAVCWTDFFQGMLMLVAVVAVPLAAISALGGWDGVVANLDSVAFISGADEFLNIFHDGGTALAAVTVLSLLAWGMGYFGMPHIVVRYMAIRHPDEIKISRRVSLIWIVIALTAAILIGIIGRAYFPTTDFAADGTAEQIFISLAGALFTPLVAGVLFAAVMAAIMST